MDHEKYLFMRMLYNIFFNYIHIFYIHMTNARTSFLDCFY